MLRRTLISAVRVGLLGAGVLSSAPPLAAQDTTGAPGGAPQQRWFLSYFPLIQAGEGDGVGLILRARYWQPTYLGERVTARAALTTEAGATTRGSWLGGARFVAPGLIDGWRFAATLRASRETRFSFFGLGNTVNVNRDRADSTQPFLYRARRTRYTAQIEVTRRITGPLHLALLGDATAARFAALQGPSVFANAVGSQLNQDDASGRLALVLDLRDNEYDTHRGALLEAGGQLGTGGDGYHRIYAQAAGWYPVREGTVVTGRVLGSDLGGTPPLDARFVVPAWERSMGVLGGPDSHRTLDRGRLAGTGILLGNFEVRQRLMYIKGGIGELLLLGFVDGGRVFEGEQWRFTLDDWAVGGGGGLALRLLRSTIVGATLGRGPDGWEFAVQGGWMY